MTHNVVAHRGLLGGNSFLLHGCEELWGEHCNIFQSLLPLFVLSILEIAVVVKC